jgi:hypothetical protein
MPIPHTDRIKTDRIKEAPAVALRAVFAGIGQLLMAVDKLRGQTQEKSTSPDQAGRTGTGAAQPAQQPANGNGNVALLRERSAAAPPAAAKTAAPKRAAPKAAAAKTATAKTATAKTATAKTAAHKPATAKPKAATAKPKAATAKPAAQRATATRAATAAAPAAAEPTPPAAAAQAAPIPGYDGLSVPSLRARLRGLDAADVQSLLAYEKTHAQRGDVITMFERRLAKIEDEAG